MKLKIYLIVAAMIAVTSLEAAQPKAAAKRRDNDKATPLLTQTEEQLAAVLQSNADRKAKADACRELAVIGTPKSLPAIIPLLADPEMNHMARYAMETMRGSAVDNALREQLAKLKGLQLVGVVGSVGVRKDAKAVKALTSLLSDSDPQVAAAAAGSLGKIGTSDALKALLAALPGKSGKQQMALAEGSLRAIEALGAKGPTRQVRAAYDQLRAMTALPVHVRVAATRGAILASGKDTKILKEALQAGDLQFVAATRAALEMGGARSAATLLEVMPSLSADKKTVVIQTLGALKATSAIKPLAAIARGSDPLRIVAIKAVAQIGTEETIPVLLELCNSEQAEVAQTSRGCLAGLTLPAASEAVMKLLRSSNSAERLLGIELAARRYMTSAMPELFQLASTSDPAVKTAAYRRIGELGGAAQAGQLAAVILKTSAPADLEAPAAALTRICTQAEKTPALRSEVVGAFNKGQANQKIALLPAVQAVGGEPALAAVKSGLNSPNPELSKAAREALADWPEVAAAPELLRLAAGTSDAAQRTALFRGYIRLVRESDLPAPTRLKMLKEASAVDAGPQGQKLVLSALGDIASVESLKLVAEKLSDANLTEEAAAAAVRIAEKLDGAAKAEAKPIIEQVAQTAKSAAVLEKAKKLLQ